MKDIGDASSSAADRADLTHMVTLGRIIIWCPRQANNLSPLQTNII
jgi:hypothetical protein